VVEPAVGQGTNPVLVFEADRDSWAERRPAAMEAAAADQAAGVALP